MKGFVFPDRASNDIYFATDDFVWGVADNAGGMVNKVRLRPRPGGRREALAGALQARQPLPHSNGSLYQFDVLGGPVETVTLGNGLAAVGAPSLDIGFDLVHVGTEAGIFYAVAVPLPPGGTCVQAAACSTLNPGQACDNSNAGECATNACAGPGSCF